jgi:hypothetical protein
VAAPLLRANIDTDAIIPSREMKFVSKTGLADGLFAGWRYLDAATRRPDPAFVLNHDDFAQASILLAGCQLRLRIVARTRGVGAARVRLPGHRRAELRCHLPDQLHPQRHPAGGAGRRRGGPAGAAGRPRGR